MTKSLSITLSLILCAKLFCITLKADEKINVNDYRMIHWNYFDGSKYAFGVTHELFKTMPEWKVTSDKTPQTTPQDAYKVARTRLDKIKISKPYIWELQEIALKPVGFKENKWVWKIIFQLGVTEVGFSGSTTTIAFLVTLNGKLIEPIITKHKR